MSKSYSTLISNKTNTAFSFQNKPVKNKKNINDLAIEECKKLYSKNCAKPNPYVLNQMKKDKLNIYLNNLKSKDLTIINRILAKFFYFKHIVMARFRLCGTIWIGVDSIKAMLSRQIFLIPARNS